MTNLTTLTADVGTLAQSVSGAKTALDDLANRVASLSAGNVSQADIDALDASVKAASASLQASVTADDPTYVSPADTLPASSAAVAPVTALVTNVPDTTPADASTTETPADAVTTAPDSSVSAQPTTADNTTESAAAPTV